MKDRTTQEHDDPNDRGAMQESSDVIVERNLIKTVPFVSAHAYRYKDLSKNDKENYENIDDSIVKWKLLAHESHNALAKRYVLPIRCLFIANIVESKAHPKLVSDMISRRIAIIYSPGCEKLRKNT